MTMMMEGAQEEEEAMKSTCIHRHPATQELSSEIQWSLDHARRHNTFCFLDIDTSSVASISLPSE
jgi:hypothetical protein